MPNTVIIAVFLLLISANNKLIVGLKTNLINFVMTLFSICMNGKFVAFHRKVGYVQKLRLFLIAVQAVS